MEGWKRLLEDLGPGEVIIDVSPSDEAGQLRGRLRLAGSRRLDVHLRLALKDVPRLESYSLQLMDSRSNCILRYDNAPHHKELPGAPHHLHLGETVMAVMPEPSLRTMLAAIKDAIER